MILSMQELSFRDYLTKEFSRRCTQNPRYSLRAFARDLGVSHQKISKIFSGKLGLSLKAAIEVTQKMNWSDRDKEIFIFLVKAKHHRSQIVRKEAEKKLAELLKNDLMYSVPQAEAESILDWIVQATYYLVETKGFVSSYDFISKRLNITTETAQKAVETLIDQGFLKRNSDGHWIRAKGNFKVNFLKSNPKAQQFYIDTMEKSKKALLSLDEKQRFFSTTFLLINNEDLPFIRKELDDFRRNLIEKLLQMGDSSTRVYGLSMQLFPFDKEL